MSNSSYKRWHRPNQSPNAKTRQGYAKIQNKDKYIGDPELIIYRSSWEFAFIKYCDMSPSVKRWSSEPVSIPYYDRVSKLEECAKLGLDPNNPSNWEVKNYNTDFWYEVDNGRDRLEKIFVEIKPSHKLKKPIPPPEHATLKEQRIFVKAAKEYLINEAKFAAIREWAERHDSKFYVFTEDVLSRILGRFWHENK